MQRAIIDTNVQVSDMKKLVDLFYAYVSATLKGQSLPWQIANEALLFLLGLT